ncbi:hypothetical protein [Flagellimonas algicola]|uniref:General secretion pathway protein L n=1 Tax=Flagellimonas algicola TaxID=2583815 RepID=A0ABY2WM32_9FLAO|nr:hypothetical protein [Allomuricauda algicola]TMU55667.1 hypothetical protein FGG15_16000 [Allomuricauda algicola]
MKNWLKHIVEGNSYQGLEIFEIEGKIWYALLHVQKEKDELHVRFEKTFDSLDKVTSHIHRNTILFLTVNTSQILTRRVDVASKIGSEQMVVTAFPNLDLENFYFQTMDLNGNQQVAISKRDYLGSLMEELAGYGLSPVQVALGTTPVQFILGHMDSVEIFGSNYKLSQDGKLEMTHNSSDEKVKMGELMLSSASITSFAQILGHLKRMPELGNLVTTNMFLFNEFKNRRLFHFGLRWSLGIFLGILLVNFLYYSSYQSELGNMEIQASAQQQLNLFNAMQERVALKEEKLMAVTNAVNSKSSFYLDRIALELPSSVLLDKITYQPTLKPVRDGKVIELQEKVILVAGVTQSKLEFIAWTSELENKVWVDKVEIESYEYVSKQRDRFALKMYLDEAK